MSYRKYIYIYIPLKENIYIYIYIEKNGSRILIYTCIFNLRFMSILTWQYFHGQFGLLALAKQSLVQSKQVSLLRWYSKSLLSWAQQIRHSLILILNPLLCKPYHGLQYQFHKFLDIFHLPLAIWTNSKTAV